MYRSVAVISTSPCEVDSLILGRWGHSPKVPHLLQEGARGFELGKMKGFFFPLVLWFCLLSESLVSQVGSNNPKETKPTKIPCDCCREENQGELLMPVH